MAIAVLAFTYPVVQFLRTVVDRATTVYDVTGTEHFISDGQAAQLGQLGLGLMTMALLAHSLMSAWRARAVHLSSWAVLALVMVSADLLRPDPDPFVITYGVMTLFCLAFAGLVSLRPVHIEIVGWITFATTATLLAFAVLSPERGWAPCREDKCTIATGLLRGYFPQENVVALFLVGLFPAIAYIRSRLWRRLAVVTVFAAVLLTGSRTGLAVFALCALCYAYARRRVASDRHRSDVWTLLGAVPVVAFAVSLVLPFVLSDRSWTGRGLIYRVIREGWYASPVIGPGRGILEDAYQSGGINWYVAHEHGQGAYILTQAGAIGVAMFSVAASTVAVACWRSRGALPAIFAAPPGAAFLTEPTWEVSLRATTFMSLLLTVALVSLAMRREPLPTPQAGRARLSRDRRPPLEQVVLTGATIPSLAPKRPLR